MVQYILDSGTNLENSSKDMGYKYGLMGLNMKVIGIRVKLKEKVGLFWQMEKSMKEIG